MQGRIPNTMPLCKHIIITLSLATCLALTSCSKQEDKLTPAEYQLMIEQSVLSGDLSLVEEIPVGIYGDKEVVEIFDTKTGEIKKVIRDRSKYAKNGSRTTDKGSRIPSGDVSNPKSPNTEHRIPNTNSVSSSVESVSNPKSQIENTKSDAASNTNSSVGSDSSVSSEESSIDPDLQQAMLEMSVQSNDIVINLDEVNSDYIDAIATNNGAIWLMGLTGPQYELNADYGNRIFEIPGVGFYLLPEDVAPDSADFIKEKISVLEEALSHKPNSPELAHELAITYAKDGGNLDKALATINSVAQKNPNNVDLAYEKAEVLRAASENQNYADQKNDLINRALENYEIAARTSKNPDAIAESAINANKILAKRGETQQGVKLLEDAYYDTKQKMSNDNNKQVVRELGQHYYEEGDYSTALDWYDKSKSDYWAFEQSKGDIYQKLGDLNNAAQSYKKSVRFNPGQPETNIKLISTYAKNGQTYEANQALRKFNNYLNKKSKKRRTAIKSSSSYKNVVKLLK